VGITTGYTEIDRMLGGLEKANVYVLAARPSMGKTALATGIARNTARAGNRTAIFELEMSAEQLGRRLIAPMCGLSPFDLKVGAIEDANQWQRLLEAQRDLDKLPLWIDDQPGLTPAKIRARARRMKRRKGLDLIIIDHLGIVAPPAEAARQGATYAVGQISNAFKRLAKELDVPVLLLCQLSRATEGRDDKRPTLADLRQSGEIEQDADVVMFIYRDSYYLERARPQKRPGEDEPDYNKRVVDWMGLCDKARGLAEIIVAKQRDGAIGTVKLAFDEAMAKFSNLHGE
jgi:replicative DNA helicase